MATLTSIDDFRRSAKAGKPAADALLRKEFVTVVRAVEDAAADGPVVVEMTISTATPDRVGDTIAPGGWKLDNYAKNPIVLFAHDSDDLPVGKARRTFIDVGGLKQEIEFTPRDLNPFGDTVGRMLKAGFLNAASVGFRPLKYNFATDREGSGWWDPIDYLEQELLENSIVPVPCNPDAVVGAKGAGIDVAPLAAWAEKTLDLTRGAGLWVAEKRVPRAALEALRKATGAARVYVIGAAKDDDEAQSPADDQEAQDPNAAGACDACAYAMAADFRYCPMCGAMRAEPEQPEEQPEAEPQDDADGTGSADESDDEKALYADLIAALSPESP
jgi:HK97 family phage prohead protease